MSFQRHSHTLPDGRRLDYQEFGDPHGAPALYLHGTPSSGSEAHWLHGAASRHGVRLVAVDRPGYLGSSAGRPGFDATASSCASLAVGLGLVRFAVVGFSGGAGHALALAHAAPDAVTVVHLGGGMGSIDGDAASDVPRGRRTMFRAVARSPMAFSPLLALNARRVGKVLGEKSKLPMLAALELYEGAAKGAQLAALEAYVRATPSDELADLVEDYVAGARSKGALVSDVTAVASPWPFELRELQVPVELWHGTADLPVPIAVAERLAAVLPGATLHVLDGEGHFVLLVHGDEVCASISAMAGTVAAR